MSNEAWYEYDGKRCLIENVALAELLRADVLFCNTRQYHCPMSNKLQEDTIVLFVNCNDVFAWGCADAEAIKSGDEAGDELYELYRMWETDPQWGATKWVCQKRNQRPQDPIRDDMKKAGAWDAAMESLPDNRYWASIRAKDGKNWLQRIRDAVSPPSDGGGSRE